MLLSAAVVVTDVNFLNVQAVRNNVASDVTCLSDPTTYGDDAALFVTCLSDPATCAWFGTMQPYL